MAKKYDYRVFPEKVTGRVLVGIAFLGGVLVIAGYFAILIFSLKSSLDSSDGVRPGAAKLVFVNRTEAVFCYDDGRIYDRSSGSVISLSASATRAGESCSASVKPDGTTVWGPQCYSDPPPNYIRGVPVDVVLSAEGGSPVYLGTARCDEETTFVITRFGDRFEVQKTVTLTLEDQPLPTAYD